MKKYAAIILMLLCFMLLGCEKSEEPVGDTQAPETVTPNEPEAPTEPEAIKHFPVIDNKFLQILKNEVPYYQRTQESTETFFLQWLQSIDKTTESVSFDGLEYAFSDINKDGIEELIIKRGIVEFLILCDINGKINGENWDQFLIPKADGTWIWHYANRECIREIRLGFEIKFDTLHYIDLCHTIKDHTDNSEVRYYIDFENVSKEEYEKYESQFSDEDLLFYSLESYMANNT